MITFPEISDNQVVLLRVRSSTGVVLDKDFNISINDQQEVYTIFESLNIAKEYIEDSKTKIKDIDFTVFDKDHSIVFYIRD